MPSPPDLPGVGAIGLRQVANQIRAGGLLQA
ncbi:MAG: hypothetical protein QOE65_693 [Solirubrobacteraceae bacterium]|jgi:hypothetical protein|nr:hypothetical protein [Solirubrobacteraceae bacterium]